MANKFYLILLLCVGSALTLLSTRFNTLFSEYINSIFYAVNMIIFSTIVLLIFLESKITGFSNKLFFLSSISLIFFFACVISQSAFQLTSFGLELVKTFSVFFLFCSVALMLLSSLVLSNDSLLNKTYKVGLVFTPLIVFAFSTLINNQVTSQNILDSTIIKFFILLYVYVYGALIIYNIVKTVKDLLMVRTRIIAFVGGLFIVFTTSGLRLSNTMLEFTGIFSLLGGFIACLALLIDSNLSLYSYSFTKLISNLKGAERAGFISFLKSKFKRNKNLIAIISNDRVIIRDNSLIDNIIERKTYEKILLESVKWYRYNVKNSSKLLKDLKIFYNNQVIMTEKLNYFSI